MIGNFCKVQKIGSVDSPRDKDHWMNFVGETLGFGFIVELPKAGERFYLYATNDIGSEKMVWTSEVVEVVETMPEHIVIKTQNSFHKIIVIK